MLREREILTASSVNGLLACGSPGRMAVCAESDEAEVPLVTATAQGCSFHMA
jgi:hypothetical protein